eukprot:6189278-Pleurochrysis_carterae.AAC.7
MLTLSSGNAQNASDLLWKNFSINIASIEMLHQFCEHREGLVVTFLLPPSASPEKNAHRCDDASARASGGQGVQEGVRAAARRLGGARIALQPIGEGVESDRVNMHVDGVDLAMRDVALLSLDAVTDTPRERLVGQRRLQRGDSARQGACRRAQLCRRHLARLHTRHALHLACRHIALSRSCTRRLIVRIGVL